MDVRDMRDTDITHMNKLSCTLAGQCQQLLMTLCFSFLMDKVIFKGLKLIV